MKHQLPDFPTLIKALQVIVSTIIAIVGANLLTQNPWLKALCFIVMFCILYVIVGMIYLLYKNKNNYIRRFYETQQIYRSHST